MITKLSSGDYFGFPSLLTGEAIQNSISVQKEGIVYMLNQAAFDYLRREYKVFEQYFVRAHKTDYCRLIIKVKTTVGQRRKFAN